MTKIFALPAVLLAFLLQVAAAKDVRSRALLQSWPAYAPTPGEAPIYEYYPQPQLPYSYSAQEPYIDTRTQSIHWGIETKGGYDILNRLATANATLRGKNIVDLVRSLDTNTALNISRASSDVLNHNIFFKTLQPDAYDPNSNLPAYVDIGNAINNNFGSMDIFQEKFREQALTLFGSGWAFLTLDPTNNYKMHIETTAGAGNPLSKKVGYSGNIPILGCDLWEHAYYLKHANLRGDFIKDWFAVINWPQVDANYKSVLAGNLNVLLLGNATASKTT